ncbi:CapA family protein [Pseudobacillus wudalianchiensis]|uniref:Capsular biosynthesis protein n=1 Tax=Pseudobacillus wudalianchiensis TaxID=1743143 RepID=A0A1B9AMW4_9BACI|nr:CapA family protein [Bacillus wudalianchiensis]OCA85162.1 capsular biosynthesis protein [Bacillus wudalianchiensis]
MNKDLNSRNGRRKRKRLKKSVKITLFVLCILIIGVSIYNFNLDSAETVSGSEVDKGTAKAKQIEANKEEPAPAKETAITISAAGDFTLGTDETFQYAGSFPDEANKNGLSYFVAELDDIFKKDDLSTVNLETTLTNAKEKAVKKFRFKGDPSYAQILKLGGIESVNLANNHIHDYLQKGYEDTIDTLKKENIGYFGYENKYLTEVKGVKVGALGYEGWDDTAELRDQVAKDIKELRKKGAEIVLVHFHWGVERQYVPEASQKTLAHYTIDHGADLVLGHHPHVVQGVEEYNGKFIVYSLGNFMFGGNRNPSDKDTYVFQQTFHLKNGKLTDKKEINVVPFSISSVSYRNNYQPKKLEGAEAERVKKKIIDVSNQINGSDWLQYEKSN